MDMSHVNLSRLKEVQQSALSETQHRIEQLQKFADDYNFLQSRLETLADEIKYDVMVPFGRFAFMPGKLVHTNEILVLLGDNWFTMRSTKQAVEIVKRRIADLKQKIDELNKQAGLLQPRVNFTHELQQLAEKRGDVYEIAEEYDEEKEKQWKEQHEINVRNYRRKQEERSQEMGTSKDAELEKLWKHLDDLEKEELEMEGSSEQQPCENIGDVRPVPSADLPVTVDRHAAKKNVRWQDEMDKSTAAGDTDDGSVEDSSTDSDDAQQPQQPNEEGLSSPASNELVSPSDIYKLFSSQTKSILKNSAAVPQMTNSVFQSTNTSTSRSLATTSIAASVLPDPISSTVIERNVAEDIVQVQPASSTAADTSEKRVSKFKASRMQAKF